MNNYVKVEIELDIELYNFMSQIRNMDAWLTYVTSCDKASRALSVAILMHVELDPDEWGWIRALLQIYSLMGELDGLINKVFKRTVKFDML